MRPSAMRLAPVMAARAGAAARLQQRTALRVLQPLRTGVAPVPVPARTFCGTNGMVDVAPGGG